jgi:hypothetical protein
VLKYVFLMMLALTSSVGAQVSPQNNTPFWRTICSRTDAAKELFNALADATKKAEACRVEQSQSRTQNIDLTEELKRARLDLASALEETKVARAEAAAAPQQAETLLKKTLSENSAMGLAYFKPSNVSACTAAVQNHFRVSSDWALPVNFTRGARARSLGSTPTCVALAWCTGITDKDGEGIVIVHVTCTDDSASRLVDAIRNSVVGLR